MNLWDFEAIDWDDEEDADGNLVHCLRRGIDERIVAQVLAEAPVEIKMKLQTAEIAIVGPDSGNVMWTLLFDWSSREETGFDRSPAGELKSLRSLNGSEREERASE